MTGSISDEALATYTQLVADTLGVDFVESDTYDFTRCVRSDGSAYGTRGKCKSGKESAAVKTLANILPKGETIVDSQGGSHKSGKGGAVKDDNNMLYHLNRKIKQIESSLSHHSKYLKGNPDPSDPAAKRRMEIVKRLKANQMKLREKQQRLDKKLRESGTLKTRADDWRPDSNPQATLGQFRR
jgi:hypothetical protein